MELDSTVVQTDRIVLRFDYPESEADDDEQPDIF